MGRHIDSTNGARRRQPAMRRGLVVPRRGVAATLGASLTLTLGLVAAPVVYEPLARDLPAAEAVPGQPGVMESPAEFYVENFENITWQEPDAAGAGSNGNDWDVEDFVQTLTDFPYGADGTEANYQPGYTNADGITYTADQDWAAGNYCNGIVVSNHGAISYSTTNFDSPRPQFWGDPLLNPTDGCIPTDNSADNTWWNRLRSMAAGMESWHTNAKYPYLGVLPPDTPNANHVVSSYTNAGTGNTVEPGAMLQFEEPLPVDPGRYYQFSIDVATQSCNVAGAVGAIPQFLITQADGTTTSAFSEQVDTCNVPRNAAYGMVVPGQNVSNQSRQTRIGTWLGDTSLRSTGDSIGIRIENEQTSGFGNDTAFDNIVVLDTTPKIDKEFSTGPYPVGTSGTLTYTVTNTYDPLVDENTPSGPKEDFAFTDVFNDPNLTLTGDAETTCGDGTVTADAGTGTVSLAGGDLIEPNLVTCTITVGVTSDVAGTYTNGPDDFTQLFGLNPPGDTDITFIDEAVCEPDATLWQFNGLTGPTSVSDVNLITGTQTPAGEVPEALNAVGFNTVTGWFVGVQPDTDGGPSLWTVSGDISQSTELGWPWGDLGTDNGFAEPSGPNSGDIDANGVLYIRSFENTFSVWAAIDVNPVSPTYLEVIDGGQTGSGDVNNTLGADWAYNPVDGLFYSIGYNTGTFNSFLWAFDPATGTETLVGRPNLDATGNRLQAPDGVYTVQSGVGSQNEFGAVYADADGYIYGQNNNTGHVWRVNPATTNGAGTGEPWSFFTYAESASGNDGARCPNSPLPVDFGDAPDSYNTLASSGGPFHGVTNDINDPLLTIGATVTIEPDGKPDVSASLDEDDAFAADPIVGIDAPTYTVSVPLTNDSGEAAALAGWIDFDLSGTFDEDERAVVNGGTTTGTVELTWTIPADVVEGPSYMRLRAALVDPDNLPTDISEVGPGVNTGEIEDWPTELVALPLDYGDAPDSYGTLAASGGASHAVVDYDETTNTAPLMLGDATTIDTEDDGVPTPGADGDDLAGVDDEGSVAEPVYATVGEDLTVDVTATNDTAEDATLVAWLDADGNGTFDAGEVSSSVIVPAGSGTGIYSVTTPGPVDAAQTYLRVRLFAGPNADPAPAGSWTGGEVEDFLVEPLLETFQCTADAYLFQGIPNSIFEVDLASGEYSELYSEYYPTGVNAVGYNVLDDYIYGINQADGLVRIGADGSTIDFGDPADPDGYGWQDLNWNAGDVDDQGVLWIAAAQPSASTVFVYRAIDVTLGSPTFGQLVDGGSTTKPTGVDNFSDWAFNPEDGLFYTFSDNSNNPGNNTASVTSFDPTTGAFSVVETLGTPTAPNGTIPNAFGAMYADSAGNLYGSGNNNGDIFRYSPDEGFTFFAYGPPSVTNDGARCYLAPVPVDYGDAPDSYGTTLDSDGARHGVVDYDTPTTSAPLMLGAVVDIEDNGVPTPDADGDDAAGTDDEESVVASGPIYAVPDEPISVSVTATNDTTEDAVLAGWVDLDGNGTFDAGELQQVVVPAGSGSASYDLSFAAATTVDATYARFRLFAGDNPDPLPTGAWTGGEVEDYLVEILDPELTITKEAVGGPESVTPGEEVTYTITIENTGELEYTTETPAEVIDDLTGVLDDATFDEGSVVISPAGQGSTDYLEPNLTWTGPIAVGEIVTVTYTVTVDDPPGPDADGILDNVVVGPPGSTCPPGSELPECNPEIPVRSLAIVKSVDPADQVTPGDDVTYTITVTNTGQVAYAAPNLVQISDNLSGILDDATYNLDAAATSNIVTNTPPAPTFNDPTLAWTGPLDIGETVTITYTVTVDDPPGDDADGVLDNSVVGPPESTCPPGSTDPECVTELPVASLDLEKTSDAVGPVAPGDTVEYTITVTNTGGVDYVEGVNPVVVEDDLTDTLLDATYNGDAAATPISGVFDYENSVLSWTGPLAVGESVELSYTVTIDDPPGPDADGLIENAVVGPPESNCDPDQDPADPDCTTEVPVSSLEIAKTSDAGETVLAGDTVTYTVTVTNTGSVDYVDGVNPVIVEDDLSGVLDDAVFNDDAAAVPDSGAFSFTEPVLMWTGPLAAGESVELSYSVTVDDPPRAGADGVLENVVVGPPESTCEDGSDDPDCGTSTPVASLDLEKTSDAVGPVAPGDTVEYTITVTNTGGVDYVEGVNPVVVEDDLTDTLLDATYNGDAAATPISGVFDYENSVLSWTGPLAVGESVELSYTVTIDDPPGPDADGLIENAVVGPPESNCDPDQDPADPDCTTEVPVSSLEIAKTSDAGETVLAGDTVTYTVTVTNTGSVDYVDGVNPVIVEDDLSGVLDDAVFNDDAAAVPDSGAFSFTEPVLMWTGPLAAGESVELSYSVTVDDPPRAGADGVLENVVVGPPESTCEDGSDDPDCGTSTPVKALDIVKSATGPDVLQPGDEITYTIEVTNTGAADYVDPDLVSISDDLTDALLDTDLVGTPSASSNVAGSTPPAPIFTSPDLTWDGPLAVGETVTIEYTLVVKDPLPADSDGVIDNAVVGPPESNCDEEQVPADPNCSESLPEPQLEAAKTSDAVGEVLPGDVVTYTVTVTNPSEVGYTVDVPAIVEDDMSGVLDDATYNDDATSSPAVGSFDFTDPSLVWTGPLGAGETITLTYSVTVDDPVTDDGDGVLVNALIVEGSNCEEGSDDPDCSVTVPVKSVDVRKSSDAGASVAPGDTVTYTVEVENTGSVPYTAITPVTVRDNLSGLLDDAEYNDDAVATSDVVVNIPPQPIYASPELAWTGPLDPGETVTITYSITVDDPLADDADGILENTVVGPPESSCDPEQDPADPDCSVTTPIREVEIVKSSEPTGSVSPGDTVTYTVDVTNTGQVDYTLADPAEMVDDLSGVLDDASWVGDATAESDAGTTPPAPVFSPIGETLTWRGPLAIGETVTVTYSVTVDDPPEGDGVLENAVTGTDSNCVPGTQDPDCSVTNPIRDLDVVKTSDAGDAVLAGDTVTYTVTVTNTGGFSYTDSDPVIVSDNLISVLDDASYNGDAVASPDQGAFDYAEPTLTWTGPLAAGESVELTYSVTVDDPAEGDGVLDNVVTGPPESTCPPDSTDPDCSTSSPIKQVSIVKTSDAVDVVPGETVTYTVLIENTGQVDYVDEELVVSDDLTEVLDDAVYNNDAAALPDSGTFTYLEPVLTWAGPLSVGGQVQLTYSITVDNPVEGDNILVNAVVGPPESNCDEEQVPADPNCSTNALTPSTEVIKTSDAGESVVPGDTVTYTVTVTNTGEVDYTDGVPLVVTDDLTEVLDDATYNDDASANTGTGEFDFADPYLEWSGPLAVGESVELSYSVTVDDPPGDEADGELTNVVISPESNCPEGSEDPDCSTSTPVQSVEIAKTSDALGTLAAGDTVAYTVTVTNTGQVDYGDGELEVSDDLTGVLDDAEYNGDASASPDQGAFDFASPTLTWTGPLAAGESVELTYSVTLDDPVEGDASLENAVVGPPESNCDEDQDPADPNCTVTDPVKRAEVLKTSDAGEQVLPGDTVTYTVTIENTGTGPYTVLDPATLVDDLTNVLDDADYNDDATATSSVVTRTPPAPMYERPELSWRGALAVGETVTITYSVTVDDPPAADGDGVLDNTVVGPPGSTCPPDSEDPDCSTSVPIAALEIAKTSDAAGSVVAGDVVTYTVTVTNTGQVDYTTAAPVEVSDDLSGVLDDAVYNDDAAASPDQGGFDYVEPTLTWTGPLSVGESVDLIYSVTVNDPVEGDFLLENAVVGPPESNCPEGSEDPDCSETVPVKELQIVKSSDGSDEPLEPGQVVEYTIDVTNVGQADYTGTDPVIITDDLSDVLDDSVYNNDASIDPDAGLLDYVEPVLSWTGPLAAGETATITYSVTVNDPDTGDKVLRNTVVGPPESNCDPDAVPADPDCTEIVPQPDLTVVKTSDAGESVKPGDTVEYSVTVENTGIVEYTDAFPAQVVDDLTFVLDDATYDGNAAVNPDQGAVTFVDPELEWSGPLAVGDSVTITYSVTVNDPVSGDGSLDNVVTAPDSNCVEGSDDPDCSVNTPIRSLDLVKSADPDGPVTPGDDVAYTVTLTNDGGFDYTAEDPAVVVDSLARVLDDATLTDGPTVTPDQGDLVYLEPFVAWVGALDAGDSVEITYTVNVNDPTTGDGILDNVAFVPPELPCTDPDGCEGLPPIDPPETCVDGVDPETGESCVGTTTPVASLELEKTSDAGQSAAAGDVVTYSVTVTNNGEVDYTVDEPAVVTDDLSSVLDDAEYNDDAAVSPALGEVTFDDPELQWAGPLAVGESVEITYSVTVNDPLTGDGTLDNAVTGPPESNCPEGSDDPDCSTSVPLRALEILKTSDGSDEPLEPGEVVTYSIAITNTGAADYTDESPAEITDDLSDVLDDAAYNLDAAVSPDQGQLDYDEPVLSWAGPLAVGESVEITYSVTVGDLEGGDNVMRNTVVGPPESNCDPDQFPADPDCTEIVPQPDITVMKSSDAGDAVVPGDTVTYSVTVENTGGVDYVEDFPLTVSDDLSGVLDDATYNDDASVSPEQGTVTVIEPDLEWSGPLAVGEIVTLTYSVTVDDPPAGDAVLDNVVLAPDSNCEEGSEDPNCSTSTPVKALEIVKTSDAGAEVSPGDTVTYTVDVTNTGTYAYTDADPAAITDTMEDVLDDATYNDDAVAAPEVGEIVFADPELTWSGPLDIGETVSITYSVTVDDPPAGDSTLTNAVTGPPESNCPVDMAGFGMGVSGLIRAVSIEDCTTTVPIAGRELTIEKEASGYEDAEVGDVVTYTVVATNVGDADYTDDSPATVVDDLTGVLDDAAYNDDASVTPEGGDLAYVAPQLIWSGPIAAGESVTLTYTVTLADGGDGDVLNVAFQPPGEGCTTVPDCGDLVPPPPGECTDGMDEDGLPCDEVSFPFNPPSPAPPGLPTTGAAVLGLLLLALTLFGGGLALVRIRRRGFRV